MPHRHAAIYSAGLLWLHWHGPSFTVKQWASRGIPAIYERSCQACAWSQHTSDLLSVTCSLSCQAIISTIVQKVAVWAANAFSLNRLCARSFHADPAVWQQPSRSFSRLKYTSTSMWTFDHCEIFECAHFKFTVSAWSVQAYTRVCNAVTLVWGSLRLAPIILSLQYTVCFLLVHTLEKICHSTH